MRRLSFGPAGSGHPMTPNGGLCGYAPPLGHSDGLEFEYPIRLAPAHAWLGHTPFALWLVGVLRPRMLVELGVHSGNSYCTFLQGVKARRLETRCFGVDHWRGDEHAGLYGDEVYDELRGYHDPLYGTFSTLLRCAFDDALPNFSDGSIDLLHIDGFHTYEAVGHDFKAWLPRMSARGVVLLHDTNVREKDFGVWRLWEEIVSHHPTFELPHSHGLGIAYVGSEPLSGPLEALFGAKADTDIEAIRGYFGRLGQSVVERFALYDVTAKVGAMQAHLAALEALEAERETERETLRSELTHATAAADGLIQAHQKAQEQIQALEADLQAARLEAIRINEHASALATNFEARLRAVRRQVDGQMSLLRHQTAIAAELQQELFVANRTLDELFRSKSWRLTAPIRFAGATLRRMLGRSA
jgi:hypothetical protein